MQRLVRMVQAVPEASDDDDDEPLHIAAREDGFVGPEFSLVQGQLEAFFL
jgi:hypothetical protein